MPHWLRTSRNFSSKINVVDLEFDYIVVLAWLVKLKEVHLVVSVSEVSNSQQETKRLYECMAHRKVLNKK